MGDEEKKGGFFGFGRKKKDDRPPTEPPVTVVEAHSEEEYLERLSRLGTEVKRTGSKLKTYTVPQEEVDPTTGKVEYSTVYGTNNPGGLQVTWRESHGVFEPSEEGTLRNQITSLDRAEAIKDIAKQTGGNFWCYPASPQDLSSGIDQYTERDLVDRAVAQGITAFPRRDAPSSAS